MKPFQHSAKKLEHFEGHLEPPLKKGDIGSISGIPIENVIARGGMGVVYRGRDEKLGRAIAIKILAYGGGILSRDRFLRETAALSKLEHPNVVSIYSAGEAIDGRPWLAMQLVEGAALSKKIGNQGLGNREAATIIAQVAAGLQAAHTAGLLHRDIKPANILLDETNDLAKLADFGLVRNEEGGTLTQTDIICGTPEYISPEQVHDAGSADRRSDVYSLGVTLYECLTGITPYRGKPMEVLDQHLNREPVAPQNLKPGIDHDLQVICLKAMEAVPANRYDSADEFADDLNRYLDGEPVLAKPVSTWRRFSRWAMKNKTLTTFATTTLLLLTMLAVGSTLASLKLSDSNQRLITETEKAVAAEQLAKKNRDAILETLKELVNSVFDELNDNGASIKSRQALADSIISGVESLAEDSSDAETDSMLYRTSLRIGELSTMKGDRETAEKYFLKAIKLCEKKHSETITNGPTFFKGIAWSKLSSLYVHTHDPKAEQALQEAIALFDSLDEAEVPELVEWKFDAERMKLILARQRGTMTGQQAVEACAEIENRFSDVIAGNNLSTLVLETLQGFYFEFGSAYMAAEEPLLAIEKLRSGLHFAEELLDKNPDNLILRAQHAGMLRGLGVAAGAAGDLEVAFEKIAGALQIFSDISNANPEAAFDQMQYADTKMFLAEVCRGLGDYRKQSELIEEAIEGYLGLKEDGTFYQRNSVIWSAFNQLSNCYLILPDWDAMKQNNERWQEAIQGEMKGKSLSPEDEFYQLLHRICDDIARFLLEQDPDDMSELGRLASALCLARLDVAQADPPTMTADSLEQLVLLYPEFSGAEFEELFEYLVSLQFSNPIATPALRTNQVLVYAQITKTLRANSAADQLIEDYHDKTLRTVKQAIELGGFAAKRVFHYSDEMSEFRNLDEYNEVLEAALQTWMKNNNIPVNN